MKNWNEIKNILESCTKVKYKHSHIATVTKDGYVIKLEPVSSGYGFIASILNKSIRVEDIQNYLKDMRND